jgi:tetrahydromethanopterin S-methyltransferase subunit A
MDSVLQNMLDIEDFNELLDRIRDLIAEQEGLLDETKKAQTLDLLQ